MYNQKLEALGIRTQKGSPHTFEAAQFAVDLAKAKSEHSSVSFPLYDRQLHDPVANALTISATDRVLLVEGLFLLSEAVHWKLVAPQLDYAVFLDIPADVAAKHATNRKAQTNNISIEAAREHVERVDMPNFHAIAKTQKKANLILQRNGHHHVCSRLFASTPSTRAVRVAEV